MPPISQSGSGLHAHLVQESSRLPIELCETIIDLIRPGDLDDWKTFPEESRALRACALVCRAWRPRAQFNLWRAVVLRPRERIVPEFTAALRSNPDRLAPLVRRMRLHPLGAVVPLDFFMPTLPNLRALFMEGVEWIAFPLRASRMRMPLLASLTELQFSRCTFRTVKDAFDIIWSCTSLTKVAVWKCTFSEDQEKITESDAARLCAARKRRPAACAKVRQLKLAGHPFVHPCAPMGSVFGCAVTELEYTSRDVFSSLQSLSRILSSYGMLQVLKITGFLLQEDPEKPVPPGIIPSLTAALPNPAALRIMVIHVVSSYRCDEDTVAAICGQEILNESGSPCLRNLLSGLTRLEVQLGSHLIKDNAWWFERMTGRIPSMRDVLEIDMTRSRAFGLYDENPREHDRKRGLLPAPFYRETLFLSIRALGWNLPKP
ncbi:hypothetical protein OH77DRAFT_1427587 [Trametes cingulata]|nr:hypothetical protein OH77DRAFT_1427587 [Trametes cingulata]